MKSYFPKLLVVLHGSSNSGKTSALSDLIDMMHPISKWIFELERLRNQDRRVVLERKGLIIGVSTIGDNNPEINKSFELFSPFDCDIVVIAAHSPIDCSVSMGRDMVAFSQKAAIKNFARETSHVALAKRMIATDAQDLMRYINYAIGRHSVGCNADVVDCAYGQKCQMVFKRKKAAKWKKSVTQITFKQIAFGSRLKGVNK